MKRLKNKVFSVIFAILTIFLVSILMIFNYQNYQQKVDDVRKNLIRMNDSKNIDFNKKPEMKEPEQLSENEFQPRIFMDSTVYAVILDEDFNITEVINHTTNSVSDEQIKQIAENIIKNEKDQENERNDENRKIQNMKIGNLYFEDYSYSFTKSNTSLVIIDNSNTKELLMQTLKTSILIFVILELVIIAISKELTSWIIKPVVDTFNKQKQFITDASHELKTPLSVIIASLEALENEPEEKKWLTNIKSESERMNNLISDLLDMAKSENKVKEQYVKEDLSKLVERAILTFESLIYEKDIKLDYNIEENINFVCNGNQIKQVVGILIDNAIKHSSSKGEIKVNLKKEKGNIILTVINKGKEIPKEEQEKIFERFYRVDESRNRNENRYGLGLAIAKNIVTNHNGKISVISENGYTTFKIILKS